MNTHAIFDLPGWARTLAITGWGIVAASLVCAAWLVVSFCYVPLDLVGLLPLAAGAGSVGIAAGLALLIVARSSRPVSPPSRFKLWAKLLLVFGPMLCLGVPMFFFGLVLFGASLTHDPTQAGGVLGTIDDILLVYAAAVSAIPFLCGLVAMIAAAIWGRRKPSPDTAGVFN